MFATPISGIIVVHYHLRNLLSVDAPFGFIRTTSGMLARGVSVFCTIAGLWDLRR